MKNHARQGGLLAVVLVSSFILSACVGGYGEKTSAPADTEKKETETTKKSAYPSKAPAKEVTKETPKEVAQVNTITIQNMAFGPATLTVKAGSVVTVTNKDAAGHSVTSDDGSFDTGILSKDKTGQFTAPTKPGTYTYYCVAHPMMKGTLIVQ